MASQSWTFGPGGIYTATWDGVETVTITLTAGGAFVQSFSGQSLASLGQVPQQFTGLPSSAIPAASLALATGTGNNGTALINGTQTLLSWAAPGDGNLHVVQWQLLQHVTSAETGGNVVTGVAGKYTVGNAFGGGSAAGWYPAGGTAVLNAGDTFYITQSVALSAGAAAVFGTIWAA